MSFCLWAFCYFKIIFINTENYLFHKYYTTENAIVPGLEVGGEKAFTKKKLRSVTQEGNLTYAGEF